MWGWGIQEQDSSLLCFVFGTISYVIGLPVFARMEEAILPRPKLYFSLLDHASPAERLLGIDGSRNIQHTIIAQGRSYYSTYLVSLVRPSTIVDVDD